MKNISKIFVILLLASSSMSVFALGPLASCEGILAYDIPPNPWSPNPNDHTKVYMYTDQSAPGSSAIVSWTWNVPGTGVVIGRGAVYTARLNYSGPVPIATLTVVDANGNTDTTTCP